MNAIALLLRQRAVHPVAGGRSNTFFSMSFLQQQRLVTVQDLACVSNIHTEGNREHKVAPTKSDLKTVRKGENSFLAMPSLLLMCCHTATCCRQRCLSWQRLIECFHFSPAFAVKMKTGCWGKEQLSMLEVIQCYKEPKLLQAGCVRGFCGVCSQGGWQSRAGNWGTVSELGLLLQRLVCCPTLRRLSLILYFESFALLPNAKWACLAMNQVASFPFPPFFQIHCLNPLPFWLKEDACQREILG